MIDAGFHFRTSPAYDIAEYNICRFEETTSFVDMVVQKTSLDSLGENVPLPELNPELCETKPTSISQCDEDSW